MSIASIASKKACAGIDSSVNTGKLGCLSLFGTPSHAMLLTTGFTIPAATDFNDAYIRPLVQKGTIIPLIDASSFEDVSSEDSYSTNTKGVKRLNLKGLPEYRLMFEEGHEFYRQIDKIESFKSYDALIGDEDGNWIIVKKSDGDFKGLQCGHITPELTRRKVEGGDAEMKPILMQFLNRIEWDRQYEILHSEDLTFTPQEVPQINGVEVTFDSVPANGNTTIDITVVLASDRSTGVEGLAIADFVITYNGTTQVISNVTDNGGGSYQLTVPSVATGQVVVLEMWHGATNSKVADSNSNLYRAVEAATETVA